MSEHEFVAFGIEAEGEVDEAVLFLGFADETAAVFENDGNGFLEIVTLNAESGPGALALAAAVDADG